MTLEMVTMIQLNEQSSITTEIFWENLKKKTLKLNNGLKKKCRYNPNKLEDNYHLDGSNDKIIQKMIELNQDPKKKQKYIESKMNIDPDSP